MCCHRFLPAWPSQCLLARASRAASKRSNEVRLGFNVHDDDGVVQLEDVYIHTCSRALDVRARAAPKGTAASEAKQHEHCTLADALDSPAQHTGRAAGSPNVYRTLCSLTDRVRTRARSCAACRTYTKFNEKRDGLPR